MPTPRCLLIWIATALIATTSVQAQDGRQSPHQTVSATVDGAKISITYGRPYIRGRKIMGGLVPYGRVWRTGADEATTLVIDKALMFGTARVPAGTYTLYTWPGEKQWKLIVNRETGQWGTDYNQQRDLVRIDMQVGATAAPVDQLTLLINDTAAGGELKLRWERTELTAPFTVAK